jgi:hypothetical protein
MRPSSEVIGKIGPHAKLFIPAYFLSGKRCADEEKAVFDRANGGDVEGVFQLALWNEQLRTMRGAILKIKLQTSAHDWGCPKA